MERLTCACSHPQALIYFTLSRCRWRRQARITMECREEHARQGGATSDVEAALEQHLLSQLRQSQYSNLFRWQRRHGDCSRHRNVSFEQDFKRT